MHFLCCLIPPRATFAADMSPQEAEAMKRHVAYWTALLDKGTVIVFGPVADPKGHWGVAVVSVKDDAEVRALQAGDPVIQAQIGMRCEAFPMPRAVYKAQS
jgi:uncharacterized protein YciI